MRSSFTWIGALQFELKAGHSIECITHAGHLVERRHIATRRRRTAVSSRLFALFDPVTLTFDLLIQYCWARYRD